MAPSSFKTQTPGRLAIYGPLIPTLTTMAIRNLVNLALSGVSDEVDSNGNLVLESPSILEWDGETRRNLFVVSPFTHSHHTVLAHRCLKAIPFAFEPRILKWREDVANAPFADLRPDEAVRHNFCLPVNRLPNELVLTIFDLYRASYGDPYTTTESHPVMTLLQVCHRWRHLAMESPSLWTSIIADNAQMSRIALEQSKDSPLNVYRFDYEPRNDADDALVLVLQPEYFPRVRVLELAFQSDTRECMENMLDRCSAPALERLFMASGDSQFLDFQATFLNGGAPRLHRAEFRNCAPHWGPSLFCSGIVDLLLTDFLCPPTSSDMDAFVKALARLECMETLFIQFQDSQNNAVSNSPPRPNASPTSLPNSLQSLKVTGTITHCARLLTHLARVATIPVVGLNVEHRPDLEDWAKECSRLIKELRRQFKPISYDFVRIDGLDGCGFSFEALEEGYLEFCFRISYPPNAVPFETMLACSSSIVRRLPFTYPFNLSVSSLSPIPSSWLISTFSHLSFAVEELYLTGESLVDEFSTIFGMPLESTTLGKDQYDESDPSIFLFPALAFISLKDAKLDLLLYAADDGPFESGSLYQGLEARRAVEGLGLHRLQIIECQISAQTVEDARRVVDVVTWDEEPEVVDDDALVDDDGEMTDEEVDDDELEIDKGGDRGPDSNEADSQVYYSEEEGGIIYVSDSEDEKASEYWSLDSV